MESSGTRTFAFEKIQGEDGDNPISLNLSHVLPGATLRVFNSTKPLKPSPTEISSLNRADSDSCAQSAEIMFRTQGPQSGEAYSNEINFQEAGPREDRFPSICVARDENLPLPAENIPALRKRSGIEKLDGTHRNSPKEIDGTEQQEVLTLAGLKKRNPASPIQEKSSERTRSTRQARGGIADVQDAGMVRERRSSRSATRRTTAEAQEDGDLGMGDAKRAPRRSNARPHVRQSTRKSADPSIATTAFPSSSPEILSPSIHTQFVPQSYLPPSSPPQAPVPSSSAATRRGSRDTGALETSGWLPFMADIVMWRDIPRSALLFGVGCFAILSSSLMQGIEYSAISIFAYVALVYLAAAFFKITFLRSKAPLLPACTLTEADVLKLGKVFLPTINMILNKLSDLFSGQPIVTLKVAAALWLLAQAGHIMNLWTLARMAYFALFVIPKLYLSYTDQIHAQARALLLRAQYAWDSCSYQKSVKMVAIFLAWNFFSVSTRVFGVFIVAVLVCVYHRGRRDGHPENADVKPPDGSRPIRMHSAPPYAVQDKYVYNVPHALSQERFLVQHQS